MEKDKEISMHQKIDKKSVFQQQASKSVMVWVTFSKTWKSTLIFIERNVKINTEYYIADALKPISLLPNDHYKNKHWTFQQDGATSYMAKISQNFCKKFSKFLVKGYVASMLSGPQPYGL